MTAGLALHNPGNVRASGEVWAGEIRHGASGPFKEFMDNLHGVRAVARILTTYMRFRHADTIDGIVRRYAPETDHNDDATYIKNVSTWTGLRIDEPLLPYRATILALTEAICRQETGFVDRDIIAAGVDMALGAPT